MSSQAHPVPRIVIAAYRPKAGKAAMLLSEVRDHHPYLYSEGLVTEREPIVMRAKDGTILEVFEWASEAAIEQAHHHPGVNAMWDRFEVCCEIVTVGSLAEVSQMFAEFEPVSFDRTPTPQASPDQREE
jgi:hypothetical protein